MYRKFSRLSQVWSSDSNRAKAPHPNLKVDAAAKERIFSTSHLFDPTHFDEQLECTFFQRLPFELRHRIYCLVMPEHKRLWMRLLDARGRPAGHAGQRTRNASSKRGRGQYKYIDHLPCLTPPVNATYSFGGSASSTHPSFWATVDAVRPRYHGDSLAFMQTCGRMYLEMCQLWTFCFDDLKQLRAFVKLAQNVSGLRPPIFHLQFVLYTGGTPWDYIRRKSESTEVWTKKSMGAQIRDWCGEAQAEELEMLNHMCSALPTLRTVLVSLMRTPGCVPLEDEGGFIQSIKDTISAAPKLTVEVLGRRDRGVASGPG